VVASNEWDDHGNWAAFPKWVPKLPIFGFDSFKICASFFCHYFQTREERRLSFFENRVLRRIFGSKRDEVTGEWRRLHNKELYALHSS
jgi:hypothetical protein